MSFFEVKRIIQTFANNVVREAKANAKKNSVTGNLVNSIKYKPPIITPRFSLIEFMMESYGKFQDKGVSGTKQKFDTPYSYKSKGGKRGLKGMPPAKPLDQWAIRKPGLKTRVRDAKGRFIKRKTLVFLIRKKIFEQGIKPTLFFTKPFEKYFKRLPDDLAKAYGKDFETMIKVEFKK